MSDYLSITEEILNLTRSMLEAAEAAVWEKVQEQEKRRQTLLKRLSLCGGLADRMKREAAEGLGEAEALKAARSRMTAMGMEKEAAANLEKTVMLNARLIDLGVHARSDMEKMMGLVQRGRKANLAYSGMK